MPDSKPVLSSASPERLWALVARPDQWYRWSPYVRGAEGLGSPEVREGAKGKVILAGGLKLPAEILDVTPGSSWTWRVGGIVVVHIVTPAPGGSQLEMPVRATGAPWKPAAMAYQPFIRLIARRIAAVAERDSGG